jgi:IS30 family transposase
MTAHHAYTVATDIPVHFRVPQSPWQRRTNENTTGPLPFYFPKTAVHSRAPQHRLNEVTREMNNGPRPTFDFHTPAETFNDLLR